jgi:hypothetical protein
MPHQTTRLFSTYHCYSYLKASINPIHIRDQHPTKAFVHVKSAYFCRQKNQPIPFHPCLVIRQVSAEEGDLVFTVLILNNQLMIF